MSEMIDRVARALAAQDIVEMELPELHAEAERRYGEYIHAAVAAIQAMRAPGDDLVEEGMGSSFGPYFVKQGDRFVRASLTNKEVMKIWQAIIDGALE